MQTLSFAPVLRRLATSPQGGTHRTGTFHVAYVTFWSVIYVALFRDRLTFLNALWLALALWVVLLVVFFPIVGWGFLGLGISVKLIPAGLVPHLLFALFIWGLSRLVFKDKEPVGSRA